MLRFLKRIGRRLGLVKLASGGEVPERVHIYLRSAFEADSDAFHKMIADRVRRVSIANQRLGGTLRSGLLQPVPPIIDQRSLTLPTVADQRLQLAAEQFAAAVIDALQNG